MSAPVICFGQQPCGFFPKRFLVAKVRTARRLQKEIGGEIVFFFHDSDHDPRETATTLRALRDGRVDTLNFEFANKLQKKFSPLYAKRVDPEWQRRMARQLPQYASAEMAELFASIRADNVADFCLEMYRGMGLLDGVRVARSSDPELRAAACAVEDCFVDVEHEGELVRARKDGQSLRLHRGGDAYIDLPICDFGKAQISPSRDSRLRWMQSALHCTHYIAGAGEIQYLNTAEAPEIAFVQRDAIDRQDEAFVDEPI